MSMIAPIAVFFTSSSAEETHTPRKEEDGELQDLRESCRLDEIGEKLP